MKKKILISIMCALVIFSTGCEKSPKLQDGKEIVAEIDGKTITAEDLYAEMKKTAGTSVLVNLIDEFIANKEIEDTDDAKSYAESNIKSLKLDYERNGENFQAALVEAGYENEQVFYDYLVSSYKKKTITENYYKSIITEKEISKYYEDEVDGDIVAKHILIKPVEATTTEEKTKAEEEALEKAKKLIEELNNGADFATLAKENSDDEGSKEDGGALGAFNKQSNFVKEFIDASYALEVGKYSAEPVKSQFGYHIIYKESQKEKPTLEEVKETIIETLANEKMSADGDETASAKAWKEMRIKYKLNIIDTTMKNIYDSAMSSVK